MQYVNFLDSDTPNHRNRRAKKRVEEVLRDNINQWYGKYTYNQCKILDWAQMSDVLSKLASEASLSVYAQGEGNRMIRKLVEEKIESKSRNFRKKEKLRLAKLTENDHAVKTGKVKVPCSLDEDCNDSPGMNSKTKSLLHLHVSRQHS